MFLTFWLAAESKLSGRLVSRLQGCKMMRCLPDVRVTKATEKN